MIDRSVLLLLLASAAMAATIGCEGPMPIYSRTAGGYGGAEAAQKSSWLAQGDFHDPQFAMDGNLRTVARTDPAYQGAQLIIDLKEPVLFQTVIIDHGPDEHGHPRKVGLATSTDGTVFLQRYQGPGTRRVTILSLPQPVLARYLRLEALQSGAQPWSIAEIFLQ